MFFFDKVSNVAVTVNYSGFWLPLVLLMVGLSAFLMLRSKIDLSKFEMLLETRLRRAVGAVLGLVALFSFGGLLVPSLVKATYYKYSLDVNTLAVTESVITKDEYDLIAEHSTHKYSMWVPRRLDGSSMKHILRDAYKDVLEGKGDKELIEILKSESISRVL